MSQVRFINYPDYFRKNNFLFTLQQSLQILRFIFMRKIFTLIYLFGFSSTLLAQGAYNIQGTVKDTINYGFTQYTSISLIRASDSILKNFTRADENGHFSLSTDSPGNYLMLFENPRYASQVKAVAIQQSETNLGIVALISRKNLIQEIVISGRQAVTIKGDTIEYAADSFKTGQYDNVDALLKQLPGLEVGSDGSIKAYGQKVEKMLVDGEEFFSDDPAMVSKMLRASSVNSVQVFDKKSEEAEFTGIDDGQRIKTINLKLKEDAKRGYFGKIVAGGGLAGYWQNEAMINAFKGKRKISAYAIMSNTKTGGLGFEDMRNYGTGSSRISGDGAVYSTNSSSGNYDWNGNYSGQGLPKTWNAGVHYGNSWWGDTLKINGSYNFAKNNADALNNTVSQYILPDTQYFNNYHSEHNRSQIRHSLGFNGEYKLDSLSSLRVRLNGSTSKTNSRSFSQSEALSLNGDLINENHQTQTNTGDNQYATAYLTYRKKFRKKGRSFSASLSGNINKGVSNGILQSEYHLYAIDSTKKIDQRKYNQNQNHSAGATFNYTEPLVKDLFLLLNYQLNYNNQESEIQSFDQQVGGVPENEILDSLYSSHYIYRILSNRGGVRLQYNPKEKLKLTVGGDVSSSGYTQEDLIGDSTIRYHYLNFFPSVSMSYRKSMQSNISFNYYGRSQQPTMSQLQPVRNNEDPLNIAIGNPDLKQSFSHSFRVQYYNYKVLTSENLFISGNFSFEQNAITMQQNVDISGRRTYQYVNVNGNYNAGAWMGYGRRIVGNLRGNVGLNGNYSRTNNFINDKANRNNSWSFSPSLSLSYHKDTTLNIYYSFDPQYNSSVSEIRTDIKTQYWNFRQSLNGSLRLPFRFKIGTEIEWEFRQQLSADDRNNKVFLWNAWVSRSFLKDQSLVFKVYANDILNQNIGYSRVTTAEQISESNYNTIQRYLMLSLTWNFTKTGSVSSNENQE